MCSTKNTKLPFWVTIETKPFLYYQKAISFINVSCMDKLLLSLYPVHIPWEKKFLYLRGAEQNIFFFKLFAKSTPCKNNGKKKKLFPNPRCTLAARASCFRSWPIRFYLFIWCSLNKYSNKEESFYANFCDN